MSAGEDTGDGSAAPTSHMLPRRSSRAMGDCGCGADRGKNANAVDAAAVSAEEAALAAASSAEEVK